MLTTPILTYLLTNHKLNATVENYYDNFSSAFLEFIELVPRENKKYERRLVVDCANGVASVHLS